jgi:hypothetical protein
LAKYSQRPDQLPTLTTNLMRHIRAIHGVVSACMASNAPLSPFGVASGPGNVDFNIAERPLSQLRGSLTAKLPSARGVTSVNRYARPSALSLHGATEIVTWSVVVTPPICICMDTASPVRVLGSGITPI